MLEATWLRAKEREAKERETRQQNAILLQHALDRERRQIQMEQTRKEGGEKPPPSTPNAHKSRQ